MFKFKKNKKSKRSANLSDNVGRKYIYHSQRMERALRSETERSSDLVDLRNNRGRYGWIKHIPTILAFLAILLIIIYITTLNDNPQIKLIKNSSIGYLHTNEQYRQEIKYLLDQSVLNRSKFTINTSKIESQFEAKYPEIDSASIIIPISGHSLQLVIKASIPSVNVTNSHGFFLLNDKGVVIKQYSSLKSLESDGLILLTDQSNSNISVGKEFLPVNTINFINNVTYQYKKKGITIQGMTLPNALYELDVQAMGQGYVVEYNLLDNSNSQIGTYLALINYLTKNSQSLPTSYVNVMVPGKAYIK